MKATFLIGLLLVAGTLSSPFRALADQESDKWIGVWPEGEWTQAALDEFERLDREYGCLTSLEKIPADVEEFCPAYKTGKDYDRLIFWTALLSAITRPESDFKTDTVYTECSKKKGTYLENKYVKGKGYCMLGGHKLENELVVSRGLLQLSMNVAEIYKCPDVKDPKDLNDPKTNIRCGALILARLVCRDNRVAGRGDEKGKWLGAAAYWAPLRSKLKKEIKEWTRQREVCRQ